MIKTLISEVLVEEFAHSEKSFVWQRECHIYLGRNVFLSKITDSLFQMFQNCSIELH